MAIDITNYKKYSGEVSNQNTKYKGIHKVLKENISKMISSTDTLNTDLSTANKTYTTIYDGISSAEWTSNSKTKTVDALTLFQNVLTTIQTAVGTLLSANKSAETLVGKLDDMATKEAELQTLVNDNSTAARRRERYSGYAAQCSDTNPTYNGYSKTYWLSRKSEQQELMDSYETKANTIKASLDELYSHVDSEIDSIRSELSKGFESAVGGSFSVGDTSIDFSYSSLEFANNIYSAFPSDVDAYYRKIFKKAYEDGTIAGTVTVVGKEYTDLGNSLDTLPTSDMFWIMMGLSVTEGTVFKDAEGNPVDAEVIANLWHASYDAEAEAEEADSAQETEFSAALEDGTEQRDTILEQRQNDTFVESVLNFGENASLEGQAFDAYNAPVNTYFEQSVDSNPTVIAYREACSDGSRSEYVTDLVTSRYEDIGIVDSSYGERLILTLDNDQIDENVRAQAINVLTLDPTKMTEDEILYLSYSGNLTDVIPGAAGTEASTLRVAVADYFLDYYENNF